MSLTKKEKAILLRAAENVEFYGIPSCVSIYRKKAYLTDKYCRFYDKPRGAYWLSEFYNEGTTEFIILWRTMLILFYREAADDV